LLAVTLIATGYWYPEHVRGIRNQLIDKAAHPLFVLTSLPGGIRSWFSDHVISRDTLQDRNLALEHENLILQRKVLQTASLMAENARLHELLNSTEILEDAVLVAELLGISPDPLRQEILLRRGSNHGIFEGQPVLDAYGLVGSVIEVTSETTRVLLITDSTNAVPVQVNRNGVRGIAEGTGRPDELYIRNLVPTTDIHEGDLIISSGLGGRYPLGYPVGNVIRIEYDGADSFLRVVIRPTARLDQSRQFLLLYRQEAKLPAPAVILTPKETPETVQEPVTSVISEEKPVTSIPATITAKKPAKQPDNSPSIPPVKPSHAAPIQQ
jgi:rod shape-determining protein MreC